MELVGQSTSLYACGSNVRVPFLSVSSKSITTDGNYKRLTLPTMKYKKCLSNSNKHDQIISELSGLKFEDQVISKHCPESISYSNASKRITELCQSNSITRQHWSGDTGQSSCDIGRYNMRGNGCRHMPCNLSKHTPTVAAAGLKCTRQTSSAATENRSLVDKKDKEQSNEYISTLAKGATVIHNTSDTSDTIQLSNNVKFNKVLQAQYPKVPAAFLGNVRDDPTSNKYVKGHKRWLALPVRASTPIENQFTLNTELTTMINGNTTGSNELITEMSKKTKLQEILAVVEELLQKWQIHVQPQDIHEEIALINLSSVSANKQLYGLGIATKIIHQNIYNHSNAAFSFVLTSRKQVEDIKENILSEDICNKICELLKIEIERIKVTSAILLCCLDQCTDEIYDILCCSSECNSHTVEQLASIQCLAIEGICNATVVKGLLFLTSTSTANDIKFERAANLLTRLSQKSNLVYAMLLEQLNSKSSHDRYITCQLLPLLYGGINRDVCNRLVTISWDDWSPDVRIVAAQALGKTGHAKLIHDEIERRLKVKHEGTKLDALRKLHSLHLMTSKLLPVYIECFNDDHISIRLEAIAIAETLLLNDNDVIVALSNLLHDTCWKIKAHAIRAIGLLKANRPDIISHLLWAVRFERLPEVRAETCHTLALLGLRNDKVAQTLRDILIVEDSQLVIKQAKQALISLGYDPIARDDMAETICAEVKKLGSQTAIAEQIVSSQDKEMVKYMLRRPSNTLSTRDYLNDKLRHKYLTSTTSVVGLTDGYWSVDKVSIDKQLQHIKKHCQFDESKALLL